LKRIKLSHPFASRYLIRQTPESRGIWGCNEFLINKEVPECDYWVVYEGLNEEDETCCPPGNTILITGEPPSIKKYNSSFLSQFGTVITCHDNLSHPHVILCQQSQPWHIGIIRTPQKGSVTKLSYDDFLHCKQDEKNKLVSVICSNKSATKGHRQRVQFVEQLQEHFGENLDVFGRGFSLIPDKWDAIYPYKYHIALENCSIPHYWTEKLADAFLGLSYPIYYGCTNASSYFPANSFSSIDNENPAEAISIIESLIKNETYEKSVKYMLEARSLVLDQYNLFPMISHICDNLGINSRNRENVKIRPEFAFANPLSKIYKLIWSGKRGLL
jgi:hypothetical protein